jgi:flagellar M-ring protein FliF
MAEGNMNYMQSGGMSSPGGRALQIISTLQEYMKQPAVIRALPMILVGFVMVIGIVLIIMMREPPMVVLFPKLAEEDKAQVMQILTNQGIKAQLDNMTGQVTVQRPDFYRAKMALASQGLPKSSATGYDLLTQMPMGTSRSVEAVKLKQAQENELARSIMEIRDIEAARVHLAVPERSAFVRDQQPPSASVFVKLSAGRVLGPGQVQSILHLVSSSVPYMSASAVTLVDQYGNLLSNPQRDADMGLTAQQLEHKTRVEKILRDRIVNLMTPIVGVGNVTSEVNVEMDFTRLEQTREIYDPESRAIRSKQESVQDSSDGIARGVPGATSNQPPTTPQLAQNATPAPAQANEAPKNHSANSVQNFEVSREVRSSRAALGEVKRLSVAVLLRASTTPDPKTGKPVEKVMSEAETQRLTQLLQQAVGFDGERGDRVSLVSTNYADEQPLSARSWYDAPWLEDAIRQGGILLVLVVVVLGALRPLLVRLMSAADYAALQSETVMGEGETIEVQEGESLEDIKARLKPKKTAITAEMLDTANSYDDKVAVIRILVGDDSSRVTAVLKQMIQRDLN